MWGVWGMSLRSLALPPSGVLRLDVADRLVALLDLDRGVVDAALLPEHALHAGEHLVARASRERPDVHARGVQPRGERPEVDVVDRLDARDAENRRPHPGNVHVGRRALEQDVGRLAQETDAPR